MEFFKHTKIYDFVKYSYYGLAISIVLIIGSFVLVGVKGFNFGIDFAGGSVAQLQYNGNAPIPQIRDILESKVEFKGVQVSEFGAADEVLIRIPLNEHVQGNERAELGETLSSLLSSTGEFEVRRLDTVGPKVGDELKYNGAISLILALLAMMAYVSFRYEWRFSLAGIVALIHDVLITAAVVILLDVDFSLEVVAALLTLIGYSINDTIIIFDRIREQMLSRRESDIKHVINEAVSRTLSRSMLTSLTIFFVVLTLYLFGGEIIVGFSLPMLAGVIVGTYSSLFLAPCLAVLFGFSLDKYYAKEIAKAKKKEEKKRMRSMYEKGQI